ncbi:helix-turn-helix domain-containing protein [Paenibacillus terrigena]|uniref:helix-turn-helix domain-containing protein n=1 Tax=Paenibacillus terrigena TaxID=369333 RepID=UPI000362FD96|nr:helix-turn-helix domain-containing protein [Paenibacillus terrigena]
MRKALQLKQLSHSTFRKLLIYFITIIMLFVTFSLFSLTLYQRNIQNEIIQYNSENLKFTTRNFEQYFELINSLLVNFYVNNTNLQALDAKAFKYVSASKIIDDLRDTIGNPQLHLYNLLVFDEQHGMVLDSLRGADEEKMISRFYHHFQYNLDFWKDSLAAHQSFMLLPATTFTNLYDPSVPSESPLVFPLLVKSKLIPNYAMLALIDAKSIKSAYHQSINNNFYILDKQGQPLFVANNTNEKALPSLPADQSWILTDNDYYFYQKGATSGYTYVNIIPADSLSAQYTKLHITLITLLVISIVISIIASVVFSMRFNNPVQKIIDTIRDLNQKDGVTDHRNQFDYIRENIGMIIQSHQQTSDDLHKKTSLLQHYDIMNQLKKIRGNHRHEEVGTPKNQTPFRFILFQFSPNKRYYEAFRMSVERSTHFMAEYVSQMVHKESPQSLIFQTEPNQIVLIHYLNEAQPEAEQTAQFEVHLMRIKELLEADKEFGFYSIAVSSLYPHTAQMTQAYEEALLRIKHRPFNDSTIILRNEAIHSERLLYTNTFEQEMHLHLQEGNVQQVLLILDRTLSQLQKKNPSMYHYNKFLEEMTDKVLRIVYSLQLDAEPLAQAAASRLPVYTMYDLEQYFKDLIESACQFIRDHKEVIDPIVRFVHDYLANHYAEAVTLDIVADKLKITSSYLSTYYKEKTGTNFVDAVNKYRVEQASTLLLHTDLFVQEIAVQTGFLNISSFNRVFKKFTGITASDYRRNASQAYTPEEDFHA